MRSDNMNDKEIVSLIEKTLTEKMLQNEIYIRYTYYELKVKYNLNENDLDRFLILIRTKLENDNYNVYFTDGFAAFSRIRKSIRIAE